MYVCEKHSNRVKCVWAGRQEADTRPNVSALNPNQFLQMPLIQFCLSQLKVVTWWFMLKLQNVMWTLFADYASTATFLLFLTDHTF